MTTDLPTSTETTFEDLLDSLTGFEEADVERRFGSDPYNFGETHGVAAARALIYVLTKRQLADDEVKDGDAKAYKHAMGLRLSQVNDFFPDDEDEPVPSEPVTESGKDDSDDV